MRGIASFTGGYRNSMWWCIWLRRYPGFVVDADVHRDVTIFVGSPDNGVSKKGIDCTRASNLVSEDAKLEATQIYLGLGGRLPMDPLWRWMEGGTGFRCDASPSHCHAGMACCDGSSVLLNAC